MKCGKLRFSRSPIAKLHLIWCAECRRFRHSDLAIDTAIEAFRSTLPGASVRRPAFARYALAAVAILIAALLLRPQPEPRIAATTPQSEKSTTHRISDHFQPSPGPTKAPDGQRSPAVTDRQPRLPIRRNSKGAVAATFAADGDYLNEGKSDLASHWTLQPESRQTLASILGRPLPPMKDDFVAVPEILVASAGSAEETRLLALHLEAEYQKEAAITDARLNKVVAFSSENDSLREICASLQKQTGVQIEAGRVVADDNATLLIKARPAREVMRAITKLFGYPWVRSGDNGKFSYVLEQDSQARESEQRIRDEDVSNALSRIVDATRRAAVGKPMDAALNRLFGQLTVSELQALRAGEEVVISSAPNSPRPMEPVMASEIMDGLGRLKPIGGGDYLLTGGDGDVPSQIPGARTNATFRFSIGELGGAKASAVSLVWIEGKSGARQVRWSSSVNLAEVKGVGEASPKNAEANADLSRVAELQAKISITPKSKEANPPKVIIEPGTWADMDTVSGWTTSFMPPTPFTTTGRLWAALHEATGIDIVADSFSRLHHATPRSGKIYDLLNAYGDQLGVRWRYQDGVVYARSTTYAWQRLNEPPKRIVAKLAQERKSGPLSLRAIVIMAQLSERQLDSFTVGQTMFHEYGIREWGVIARPWLLDNRDKGHVFRQIARILSPLAPAQLDQLATQPVPVQSLPANVVEQLMALGGRWDEAPAYIAVSYVPESSFYWQAGGKVAGRPGLGLHASSTADLDVKLKQAGIDSTKGTFIKTYGHFKVLFFNSDGMATRLAGDAGMTVYVAKQDK